ncbi:MAG: class I SAM-dependent methyltransferase [Phycisphaerales bacterium JB041]
MEVLLRNARTLRILCDRFGVEPSITILERIADLYDRRPSWITAESHPTDLLILYLAARGLTPGRVVEIGVASGMSTCGLLAGLADGGVPATNPRDGRATVQSFDILEHVPWDKDRPIGSAIAEILPDLAAGAKINTSRTSLDLPNELGDVPVELAFIDGSHSHPWPLIDAIQVSKVMSPDGWIILHDVALVERAMLDAILRGKSTLPFRPSRGSEWHFELWPSEKLRGSESGHNVALVRPVAPDTLRMHPNIVSLVSMPWESAPPPAAEAVLVEFCGSEAVERGKVLGRPGEVLIPD